MTSDTRIVQPDESLCAARDEAVHEGRILQTNEATGQTIIAPKLLEGFAPVKGVVKHGQS